MILLDGRLASAAVKEKIKNQTDYYLSNNFRKPHLAAILVGNNGASETYVASKVKNCAEVGFASSLFRFDASISEDELLNAIKNLNNDTGVDGILVQLPLPKHISENAVIETILPNKDVDGFHPINVGKVVQGLPAFIPATPLGVMLLLEHYQISTKGKHAVVIGRSNIVGRPMSILLSSPHPFGNCTVTLCHSHTNSIRQHCLEADIVIAALGKPGFVTADMIKKGAIVIDVGITRVDDASSKRGFKIKGDVAFDSVSEKAAAITPVPGGVGLMTIAGLLQNTLRSYQNNFQLT